MPAGGSPRCWSTPTVRQRSARLDLGCVVAVTGRIRGEEGGVRLIASDLKRVAGSPAEIVATETAHLQRIRETAARHPGGRPLLLRLEGSHYRAAADFATSVLGGSPPHNARRRSDKEV